MRDRDRLFEVVKSLNMKVVGLSAVSLEQAAYYARIFGNFGDGTLQAEVKSISKKHPSPHVRELATELLALK